ncbi:hypothetical protein T4B_8511 [Trichinella pseudospiralis]|uniref:Uncharacterized protein n=1 Tax=Trichinella pseudospiralis TaxID=6337 RepID=A0A0V1GN82_TRIPS|nr:hypothetical protein T4B_8511 [Trichinella pseudospiralis]
MALCIRSGERISPGSKLIAYARILNKFDKIPALGI